ncbi:MAG TPA: tRNA pseudouridine(55) synthase TruB [Anaeromyxobacteraceae bacterium]|nr:tRNA pseudouridine(55) synthase TruB [Anaeromyxobacteraceae bacterium]
MPTAISGLLVIDKPAGPTSFDVVTRVKRLLRARKAGHTGTLDPLATGVLVVCLGEAVKLQQWLTEGDKAYEALVAFGAATTTEDAEGEVVARGDPGPLDAAGIRAALPRFTGLLEQVPPMFSAVRVGGRRLHEAARAGEVVERAPRQVRVDAFDLLELGEPAGGLRLARLAVRCGKGTYVRTLAADLGHALGVPAHLAGLRRTAAGSFGIADAVSLDQAERLGAEAPEALAERVVPLAAALRGWPTVLLTAGEARDLGHGKALLLPAGPEGLCGALDPHGGLLAVCEGRAGTLHPLRVLAPSIR